MVVRRIGEIERDALLAGLVGAIASVLLLRLGPPGVDLAAHVYQRTFFLRHGFVLWNNFWYAGRYSFVDYSVLYYPLAALVGTAVVAVASVASAAAGFALVVGREWGRVARLSSAAFAVVWASIVLSAAYPFALGFALALIGLAALQRGRVTSFAVLALLALAASPLAFVLLGVALAGLAIVRRPERRRLAVVSSVVGVAVAAELLTGRLFPAGGRYPFRFSDLVPAVAFCLLVVALTIKVPRARPLAAILGVYLVACVAAYLIPSAVGSNVERLRYASFPLALLALSLARWRPLCFALPLLAVALIWNGQAIAHTFQKASADTASQKNVWAPSLAFLRTNLSPSYRVEAVDTVDHWAAAYLPSAGVPIVRGWFRQNDFPQNELLYDRLVARDYRAWLRSFAVRYVLLTDSPPDYSAREEAKLLRSGRSGLRPVFHSAHATVFELPHARPLVTGPGGASVLYLWPTRVVLAVDAPGRYRVAVRWSPYWRTYQGCVERAHDGMLAVTARRAGIVDLDFKVGVSSGLKTLTGLEPKRACATT